ncbi:LuxR C-terminal-related transcriptional regulator [Mumia qirimensis]|uniref:LuxR C-terminal-related transcriptional regulator n=1 Tax=Mumia qirimensis TaxID=3234852 RepID=UPI00351D624F
MTDSARWIEVAADLLALDDVTEARRCLTDQLLCDFGATGGARVVIAASTDDIALQTFPRDIAFDTERWPYGQRTIARTHPLVQHYRATGSMDPEVLVQPGETTRSLPAPLLGLLHSVGVGLHQLVLPLRNDPQTGLVAYVLVRDDPFPRWARLRASALLPLIRGLDRHLLLRLAEPETVAAATSAGVSLTPREHTIITMLAESRTAESIGRSLGISARTVHKHLENVYRKLGVSDRVAALQLAYRRGLIVDAPGADAVAGARPPLAGGRSEGNGFADVLT